MMFGWRISTRLFLAVFTETTGRNETEGAAERGRGRRR